MILVACADPEISTRGGGGRHVVFFRENSYFTEGRTDLHREAIGPGETNCFSRGYMYIQEFLMKPIPTCDFPGKVRTPVPI